MGDNRGGRQHLYRHGTAYQRCTVSTAGDDSVPAHYTNHFIAGLYANALSVMTIEHIIAVIN